MAALTVDLSRMPKAVRERVNDIWVSRDDVQRTLALIEQRRMSKLYNENARPGWAGNHGTLDMVVHPYLRAYFSRVCDARELVWDDPQFIQWLKKNEPSVAVKHQPTKVQVGYR